MFSFMKKAGAAKAPDATSTDKPDTAAATPAITISPARKAEEKAQAKADEKAQIKAEKAARKMAKPKLSAEERKAQAAQKAAKMAEKQAEIMRAIPGLHWLAAILLVAALGAVGLTVAKGKAVASIAKTNEGVEAHANIKLDKTPLTEAEYTSITEWYSRMHPSITFLVDKRDQALIVTSAKPENHADWIYALAALQARDTSVLWESENFCVGRCDSGPMTAKLKGYRQKISVE